MDNHIKRTSSDGKLGPDHGKEDLLYVGTVLIMEGGGGVTLTMCE